MFAIMGGCESKSPLRDPSHPPGHLKLHGTDYNVRHNLNSIQWLFILIDINYD